MNHIYSELYHPAWPEKRRKILYLNSNQCSLCKNYKLLKTSSIGYLQKTNEYGSPTEDGFYQIHKLYRSLEEFSQVVVKYSDYYVNPDCPIVMRKEVMLRSNVKLTFKEDKYYLIYVDIWSHQAADSLSAVIEIDFRSKPIIWDNKYEHFKQNPFRQKKFISSAKFTYAKDLHAHPLTHIKGVPIWALPDDSYQCICEICLKENREKLKVTYMDDKSLKKAELTLCSNCLGQGIIYRHLHPGNNGQCYKCKGKRYEELIYNSI